MAETNITECTCASFNQNFPNLEACNTYGVQDLKNLFCRSSSRQMFIIHLNTRSLSKNISKMYQLLTDIVITPDIIARPVVMFPNRGGHIFNTILDVCKPGSETNGGSDTTGPPLATALIIAISETKLNNKRKYNDIQLPGYTFINKISLIQAGGVRM